MTGGSASRSSLRFALALFALLVLAWGVRTAVMEWTFPVRLLGDERYYVNTALNIASGRGHVFKESSYLWRPPAHAWLLSRFVEGDVASRLDAVGDPVDPALHWRSVRRFLRVEIVLSTLLVGATAALGWALFDPRVALVAATLAAVYPNLVAYSHYLWSETLFSLLVISGLAGIAALARRPAREASWLAVAAVGLGFGAAGLTREIAGPIAAAAVGWWVWQSDRPDRRSALARGALVLGLSALVIAPWTIRNYQVHGRLIPVSSIGWFATAQGNALEPKDWLLQDGRRHVDFEREYFAIPGEIERMDFARDRALAFIASEQPSWIAKKAALNLSLLLSPDSYVLYKMRRNSYREIGDTAQAGLRAASVAGYVVVLVAGVVGIAGAGATRRRWLPVVVFGVVGLVHVLANADTRFRLPWMPVLIVYAAFVCVEPRRVLDDLHGPRRWLAVAAVGLFFGVCVPYFMVYGGRR